MSRQPPQSSTFFPVFAHPLPVVDESHFLPSQSHSEGRSFVKICESLLEISLPSWTQVFDNK
jgi:hypothetical protein